MATLDLLVNEQGAWSNHFYSTISAWGTLGVVHATLDHALARQMILCAFADGSYPADYMKLAILEYGTTDNWNAAATDGTKITSTIVTRSLSMKAPDRWKKFLWAHIRHRLRQSTSGVTIIATFKSSTGGPDSRALSQAGSATSVDQDWVTRPTETSGGPFRDVTPTLTLAAISDTGWTLADWVVKAALEPEKPL
jgi:hypothetical protein